MRIQKDKLNNMGVNLAASVAGRVYKRLHPPPVGSIAELYGNYKKWVNANLPDYTQIYKLQGTQEAFEYTPIVSIVMPVTENNTLHIQESIDSVMGQIYEKWELCIAVSSSCDEGTQEVLFEYAGKYKQINILPTKKENHEADIFNRAVEGAKGDYIAILGQGDVLWPNALYEIVRTLNEDNAHDFLYTDEDQIPDDRHDHVAPFLKPDWSPELLKSVNYVSYFSVIKKNLLIKSGRAQSKYGNAYLWELSFRMTHEAHSIHHIANVVYSRRLKLDKNKAELQRIESDEKKVLDKHGPVAGARMALEKHEEMWDATYSIAENPLISIIIPTKDQYQIVKRCVASIFNRTSYKNFEVIIVDTGSDDRRVLRWYKRVTRKHSNVKIVNWHEQPFSYSRSCNEGARHAMGKILVMLNNDTEVVTSDWLEQLGFEVQRPNIGVAGPLLTYMDGRHVQHAGVGVGLGGVAANLLSGLNITQPMTRSQYIMLHARHNVSALTGACLAIEKDVFEEVGGFDESFRITYNDVDLCLRLIEKGYSNIYIPTVHLKHYESLTLGLPGVIEYRDKSEFESSKKIFIEQWKQYVNHDPAINTNVDKSNAFYEINMGYLNNHSTAIASGRAETRHNEV